MTTQAQISTSFPNSTSRARRCTVGGQDVLVGGLNVPTADIDSIVIDHKGYGEVSSLTMTIWDPLVAFAVELGAEVQFHDIVQDKPLFLGFVTSFVVRPSAVGRWVDLDCTGVEVLLDWMLLPDFTASGLDIAAMIQALVANAITPGFPIRAFQRPYLGTYPLGPGSQAYPIETDNVGGVDAVITGGTTLRNAIDLVVQANGGSVHRVTIDFYGGLRVEPTTELNSEIITSQPTDYGVLSVANTSASLSVQASMAISTRVDGSDAMNTVYVKGANAASSGPVVSPWQASLIGPVGYLDTTSLDPGYAFSLYRDLFGRAYLQEHRETLRGTASFDPMITTAVYTPPGAYITFGADSQTFSATASYMIYSIRKTFSAGGTKESWTVSFGGNSPSTIATLRYLTRDTR